MSEVATSWVGGSPFQPIIDAPPIKMRNPNRAGRPVLRRCASCSHADFQRTVTGRIVKNSTGRCDYVILLPALPACVNIRQNYGLENPNSCKSGIRPGDGATCPVWKKPEASHAPNP